MTISLLDPIYHHSLASLLSHIYNEEGKLLSEKYFISNVNEILKITLNGDWKAGNYYIKVEGSKLFKSSFSIMARFWLDFKIKYGISTIYKENFRQKCLISNFILFFPFFFIA